MTELGINVARKLKEARAAGGFEQKYVAAQIGISESKLSHYENGRAEPDIDTLYKLSRFYAVSLDDWLNLSDLNEQIIVVEQEEKMLIRRYREVPKQVKEDIRDYVNMKYSKYVNS